MKKSMIIKSISFALVVLLSGVLSVFSASSLGNDNWKDKITSELYQEIDTAQKDEKIPVYVWYTDINQQEVRDEVKTETGLSLDNLDTDIAMPDQTVLDSLTSDTISDQTQKDMNKYLEKTEKQREKEKEKTDKYIKEERKVSKDKYTKKGKDMPGVSTLIRILSNQAPTVFIIYETKPAVVTLTKTKPPTM